MSPHSLAVSDYGETAGHAVASQPTSEQLGLVDVYKKWFDVVPANTPALLEESWRLRYQVYCLETGFEEKDDFPDGLERDEFDDRSVASLLVHKPSGRVAGTVRLILPVRRDGGDPELPATRVSSDIAGLMGSVLPPATTAEISRFSISKAFRQRQEDGLVPAVYDTSGNPGDKRVIPSITLGLMQAILRMSTENNITHACILIEPALDRLVKKLGIHFTPIGPMLDYHGRRRAFYCEGSAMTADIYSRRPDIWSVLADAGRLRALQG